MMDGWMTGGGLVPVGFSVLLIYPFSNMGLCSITKKRLQNHWPTESENLRLTSQGCFSSSSYTVCGATHWTDHQSTAGQIVKANCTILKTYDFMFFSCVYLAHILINTHYISTHFMARPFFFIIINVFLNEMKDEFTISNKVTGNIHSPVGRLAFISLRMLPVKHRPHHATSYNTVMYY